MVQLLLRQRKQFAEIVDDPIGIAQALPAAIAVGHATSPGTGILAHLNVVCRIAHNDGLFRLEMKYRECPVHRFGVRLPLFYVICTENVADEWRQPESVHILCQ